jgi:hypothetical protein
VTLKTAAIKDASRREDAVAKRPSLTATIPGVLGSSGRDGETALSRTKKRLRKTRLDRYHPHQTARRHFFDPVDNALLNASQDPRVNIAGVRRADLLPLVDWLSPDRLSRQLRRLRDIGVIKRVTGTYRYYLTRMGRAATAALCRVTESIIIPMMA